MTRDELLDVFRKSGALLDGHFRLTSGLHSPGYLQCALVLQHPRQVVGAASIVDRGAAAVSRETELGVPFATLLRIDLPTYDPDQCPLCAQGLPVVKPGSRMET